MRADRLIALLMFLQRRGRVTAAEVAQELEISERTARRDLEALAMSGVPVYSQHGRGGGWQLVGGATTNLSGLSADEARALFLAIGPAAGDTPELRAALRKLSSAIPETFRADAEAAATAVKIDPAGWGRIGAGAAPPHLDILTDAVVERRQVRLSYESPRSGPSERVVHPLGLVTKRNVWYLVADTDPANHPTGLRTFRLSRVRDVALLDDPVFRPADFDLDTVWAGIVTEFGSWQSSLTVDVLVEPHLLRPLQWQFSGRITVGAVTADGRVRATVVGLNEMSLASLLAGYGAGLEVEDPPPALLQQLQRITAELSSRYG